MIVAGQDEAAADLFEARRQVPEKARIELDAIVVDRQRAAHAGQRGEGHLLHAAVAHGHISLHVGDLRKAVARAPVGQIGNVLEDEIAVDAGDVLKSVDVEESVAARLVVGHDVAQHDATAAVDLAEEGLGGLDRSAVDRQRALHDLDLRSQRRHTVIGDLGASIVRFFTSLPLRLSAAASASDFTV